VQRNNRVVFNMTTEGELYKRVVVAANPELAWCPYLETTLKNEIPAYLSPWVCAFQRELTGSANVTELTRRHVDYICATLRHRRCAVSHGVKLYRVNGQGLIESDLDPSGSWFHEN
jgi:hypothetical protein